jgi:hypothetical protein
MEAEHPSSCIQPGTLPTEQDHPSISDHWMVELTLPLKLSSMDQAWIVEAPSVQDSRILQTATRVKVQTFSEQFSP